MVSHTSIPLESSLRPGAPADEDACVSLWVTACAIRDGHPHPGVAERARSKFETGIAWIVVERSGGELAGFALATSPGSGVRSDPPDAAVLGLLAVDPLAQGHGFGRKLLTAVTSAIAAGGYKRTVLHVLSDNIAAVRLYESAGWIANGAPFTHPLLNRPFQTYLREL